MEPRSREEETGVHCRTSATYSLRARRGRLVPAALLALGLGCGLLAQVVFGLGDAMRLGHLGALITWYVVGWVRPSGSKRRVAKKRKPWHDNA